MKNKKVLIVDNNDLNRKLLESLIGQIYTFEAVNTGVKAVEKAYKEKFDLILMDIQMPDMDGVTASKIIRRKSEYQCPIIAITAYSAESAKKNFLELGFSDLITKPIRPKEFMEVISSHITSTNDDYLQGKEGEEKLVLDKKVILQLQKFNSITGIKALYTEFLEEFDQLIGHIDLAFQEKNKNTLIECLHTVKGNSGTLGANTIYVLSSDADVKAQSQDWTALETVLRNLKNERIIFEKYLEEETTFST
ncbi:CheY-like chemotaxis protein/HPt (histidine-containing phosphotransfer) domain-containing protein [Algoriphagus sp. 4150]|uniref:response regulator n=1 Tax=Algoriphagus sp. 4150 TaxID=2817756 RepID=UPI0028669C46|nr:response regulator [Algoriphagus sp. 4150]MDR7130836.1 CheY-like chemotaxis protein/HPt (histidine-containing phosphotransfer) domain-containing protein [Algoriphagus sp. 4150]